MGLLFFLFFIILVGESMKEQKNKYLKKGQFTNGAVGSIITLTVGVGVAILVIIFVGSLGGQSYEIMQDELNQIGGRVQLLENFTMNNDTWVKLEHGSLVNGTITVQNGSEVLSYGQFDYDFAGGRIMLIANHTTHNGSTALINYTWGEIEIRHSINNGIMSGFQGLQQTGDYIPIIVLSVIIALILGFLLTGPLTRSGGGGQAL